ncbi:MAG: hypothetical protein Q7T33_02105 [Dehalococcoidia bacterium]|nr:hypothetical protein [Dehalococcoidia bacterium]
MSDKRATGRHRIEARGVASPLNPDHVVLEPGEIGAVLEWTVRRADGTVRERVAKKAESYVRQFLDLLLVQMTGVPEVCPAQITDTSGALRDVAASSLNFDCAAVANIDAYGVVVGIGAGAPTIGDYALQSKIAHGVGAGQLQYGGVAFGMPTSNLSASHFTVTRDFANGSGNPIVVYEIGLYVKGDMPVLLSNSQNRANDSASNPTVQYFCTIRDVIGTGITILNGETLTVNYRQECVV